MILREDQNSIAAECAEKRERLLSLMRDQRLDAVVISRHENIAWLTAGRVDVRVGLLRETGPASLLVTKEGADFYITTGNEAARLAEEEFATLPYKPLLRPWTSIDVENSIRSVVPQGRLGTDIPLGEHTVVNLQPLRLLLTSGEVDRYRWLGQQLADAVTKVILSLEPGMNEHFIQATVAHELISRGLLPSVHLEAVDGRILAYPHPVPRAGVLERFAMLGLCARFGGLTASITRFAHFGPLPDQLANDFGIVSQVNARVQAATRTGATAGELFTVLQNAYTEAGAPGGEQGHHQGGAAGYLEREWVARPGGLEKVTAVQAFAWNPNLHGAKVEDTRLLLNNRLETITRTPALPEVSTLFGGVEYITASAFIR
jgi:antitoxin VapB